VRNSKGFTLIELVMVLVVVAILARSVTVATNAIKRIQLENAADKVTSDLRYAQYMASSSSVWYGVSFEVTPLNHLYVYTTYATGDSIVADPGKAGATFIVDLSGTYSISINAVTVEGGAKKIEFSPSGSPYRDRTAAILTAESVVTLSNGVSTKTVRVTPSTGRVYQQ
jgi:prepilin-type N-terminal cleavage/methylation domain-containing protein